MNVGAVVLDTSALVAVIRGEPGADKVRQVLGRAFLSSVNLTETIEVLVRLGMARAPAENAASRFPKRISSFDDAQGLEASRILSAHRRSGFSLGDACCVALAVALNAEAMTADRVWATLNLPIKINLIR